MAKNAKKGASKGGGASAPPTNAMDYPEHQKTYDLFLWLSKWTVIFCAALLIAMVVGFYGGGGLFGGIIVFVVLMLIGFFAV